MASTLSGSGSGSGSTYFLTGALGCIGASIVKHLVETGHTPVVYDLSTDPRRIRERTREVLGLIVRIGRD